MVFLRQTCVLYFLHPREQFLRASLPHPALGVCRSRDLPLVRPSIASRHLREGVPLDLDLERLVPAEWSLVHFYPFRLRLLEHLLKNGTRIAWLRQVLAKVCKRVDHQFVHAELPEELLRLRDRPRRGLPVVSHLNR